MLVEFNMSLVRRRCRH